MKASPTEAQTVPGLDAIDLRILDALQRDTSHSTSELAESVGLSMSPCWRRVNRLAAQARPDDRDAGVKRQADEQRELGGGVKVAERR